MTIRTPQNVLLLSIDALRADEFSRIREALPSSLNTVSVDRCVATGPGTSTAFPGILTSTFPLEYTGYEGIGPERTSIAEVLADSGFETAGFHSNPLLSRRFNYDRGFDTFYDSVGSKRQLNSWLRRYAPSIIHRSVKRAYYHITEHQQLPYDRAEPISKRAINWIEGTNGQWFCWTHYMDPHHPYKPPAEYTNTPEERIDTLWKQLNENPTSIADSEINTLRTLYQSEIEYLADSIANLLQSLKDKNMLKETLVILTADHGEEFRDHGDLLHKPKLHQELVEVPLLFTGGVVTESNSIDGTAASLDIPTTILDKIDEQPPASWRGETLADGSVSRDGCFSELSHASGGGGEVHPDRIKVAYRTEDWTFIHDRQEGTNQLYHRQTDPVEQSDVYDEHKDVARLMQSQIDRHIERVLSESSQSTHDDLDDSIEARLENLGYK